MEPFWFLLFLLILGIKPDASLALSATPRTNFYIDIPSHWSLGHMKIRAVCPSTTFLIMNVSFSELRVQLLFHSAMPLFSEAWRTADSLGIHPSSPNVRERRAAAMSGPSGCGRRWVQLE